MSAVLVLGLAAGCAAEEPADVPPVTEQSSTPAEPEVLPGPAAGIPAAHADGLELNGEEADAAHAAVVAVQNFLNYEDQVLRRGGDAYHQYGTYASGEMLNRGEDIAEEYSGNGWRLVGTVVYSEFSISSLALHLPEDEAEVSYCADISQADVRDGSDETVVLDDRPEKVESTVRVLRENPNTGWKVDSFVGVVEGCGS
ncbi:hypothetical protein [Sediminivirga luteola]|uniref:hypothetical protein n=1 Tax=Sediminivirga luteola TaxID=1774748 RepID=UPI001F5762CD|nr:hypothetical protein [Sediminivirga luteola]MCI2264146.1 hypothetical protein [Sediminivirga luteola]